MGQVASTNETHHGNIGTGAPPGNSNTWTTFTGNDSHVNMTENYGKIPQSAFIFSILLAMLAITTLMFLISRRIKTLSLTWFMSVPYIRKLLLLIYVDSFGFVFSSTILQASFGLNSSKTVCGVSILLCLCCYLTSKLIYAFMLEKSYIINEGSRNSRPCSYTYRYMAPAAAVPYVVIVILCFVYRNTHLDQDTGQCRIGLRLGANIPLLVFDLGVNIFLTGVFLFPLIRLRTNKYFNQMSPSLKQILKYTFWGSLATLGSSIANLTTLLVLDGKEPGWICFACCNADILFSALVLYCITAKDAAEHPDDPGEPLLEECARRQGDCCTHPEGHTGLPKPQPRNIHHKQHKRALNEAKEHSTTSYTGPGKTGGEVRTQCDGVDIDDNDDDIETGNGHHRKDCKSLHYQNCTKDIKDCEEPDLHYLTIEQLEALCQCPMPSIVVHVTTQHSQTVTTHRLAEDTNAVELYTLPSTSSLASVKDEKDQGNIATKDEKDSSFGKVTATDSTTSMNVGRGGDYRLDWRMDSTGAQKKKVPSYDFSHMR